MALHKVKLPDMGEGTTQAELVNWHVKAGDLVDEDELIAEFMTDKATIEMPSPVSGRVLSTVGERGDILAVGSEILVIDVDESGGVTEWEGSTRAECDSQEFLGPRPGNPANETASQHGLDLAKDSHSHKQGQWPNRALASPSVRSRARQAGLDLHLVKGSGPSGRVMHSDLDSHLTTTTFDVSQAAERPKVDTTKDVKVVGLRRIIAERMQDAKRRIPHFSYVEEVNVTNLEEVRSQLNEKFEGRRPKLTLIPFLVSAVRQSIVAFPQMNARFDDASEVVTQFGGVHVGIATQTDQGLMVPVIKHAESLDFWQIADQLAELARVAREGKVPKDKLSGSTITITSLGSLGGIASTPIINSPEVAIIGVNKIVERPVVHRGGVQIQKMMNLSSSFDHRVVDGMDAARFVQSVRSLLQAPALLLVD
jgi:2-oxoisovalerate dehydrogenase E2 component (dihydrolipoyl transacylase)